MDGLRDKVALVTGGASGIGAGICEVLAQFGCRIAVGDLEVEQSRDLAAKLGGEDLALAVLLNVADRVVATEAIAEVERRLGPVEILVNNAGVSSARAFLEISDEEYARLMNVNLRGVFLMSQLVLPGMLRAGWGRIVNISSMAGKEGLPNLTHYCASKFGVVGLTQALAKEVAPSGVTVNAVCPGVVRTPLWDDPDKGILNQLGPEAWDQFVAGIPLGRPQTTADVGYACAYLASEYAGNITGESINVSGGQQVH
jgi:meso-butanediol dehydrogenase / (S,S)-butanediol dehydrogenase / diacetyl reductase